MLGFSTACVLSGVCQHSGTAAGSRMSRVGGGSFFLPATAWEAGAEAVAVAGLADQGGVHKV